jgi:hypothetical protein
MKGRDRLEYAGVDFRIISKLILNKSDRKLGTLSDSRQGPEDGSCEHIKELPDSIKDENFLDSHILIRSKIFMPVVYYNIFTASEKYLSVLALEDMYSYYMTLYLHLLEPMGENKFHYSKAYVSYSV